MFSWLEWLSGKYIYPQHISSGCVGGCVHGLSIVFLCAESVSNRVFHASSIPVKMVLWSQTKISRDWPFSLDFQQRFIIEFHLPSLSLHPDMLIGPARALGHVGGCEQDRPESPKRDKGAKMEYPWNLLKSLSSLSFIVSQSISLVRHRVLRAVPWQILVRFADFVFLQTWPEAGNVYLAAEVNLIQESLDGKKNVVNAVLPFVSRPQCIRSGWLGDLKMWFLHETLKSFFKEFLPWHQRVDLFILVMQSLCRSAISYQLQLLRETVPPKYIGYIWMHRGI